MPALHFVHIPKTGGTSIEEAYRGVQPFGRYALFPELATARERARCAFWHEHAPVLTVRPGAASFCVVRDPVARLLSEYRYRALPDDVAVFNATLREWRARIAENPYYMQNHFCPQALFARQCTHCLLVDHLDATLPALLRRYHITPRPMRRANRSKVYTCVTGAACFTADNYAWIRQFYRDDFALVAHARARHVRRAVHRSPRRALTAPNDVATIVSARTDCEENNRPRSSLSRA